MNKRSGNRKAVTAAALTALVMGAIGGTAAIAGSKPASNRNVASVKSSASAKKAKKVKQSGKKGAGTTTAPAPHDEAAEHAAFAAALASKLGVSADQVTAALEAIRPAPGTRPDPGGFPKALADKLGKTEAEVKEALDSLRSEGKVRGPGMGHGPDGDHGGPDGDHHGPGGPEFAVVLAAKLGVTSDQLKAAFDSIRPPAGTRPDRSQLPAKLAAALGKSEAEVKAALDSVRPPDGPHGPDGPGFGRGHR